MRDELMTPFWREAYGSLPAQVRERYLSEFVAAERWELTIGSLIESWTRAKKATRDMFQTLNFAK
ncbi:MAG TPA: hypothetical protein VFZ74_08565 [Burkholderiales bacterium]